MKSLLTILLLLGAASWFMLVLLRGDRSPNHEQILGKICVSIWLSFPYLIAAIAQYTRIQKKYSFPTPASVSGLSILITGSVFLSLHLLLTDNTLVAGVLLLGYPLVFMIVGIVSYLGKHLRQTSHK
jgi:hypothetical protein